MTVSQTIFLFYICTPPLVLRCSCLHILCICIEHIHTFILRVMLIGAQSCRPIVSFVTAEMRVQGAGDVADLRLSLLSHQSAQSCRAAVAKEQNLLSQRWSENMLLGETKYLKTAVDHVFRHVRDGEALSTTKYSSFNVLQPLFSFIYGSHTQFQTTFQSGECSSLQNCG